MTVPYCDSNVFVRLYAEMPDSETVLALLARLRRESDNLLPITWLHQLEINNALQQMVFLARSGQGGRVTPELAAVALARFDEDIATRNGLKRIAITTDDLLRVTRQLSQRHTAKHGFRAYDIVHVASALLLECDTFWSFDAKASKLAKLEGLKVL